jgi:8-oxo-dGTP pyrophosphatase MutT (NUDIX family)
VRRPEEVFVVVHRPAPRGREFLVVKRSPEREGYWHLVAGALEWGEDAATAAARELQEETELEAAVTDLGRHYVYSLAAESPDVRARFAEGVTEIGVAAFVAEAPPGWDPTLDDEHVGFRWCSVAEAIALLQYAEPRDAVELAARQLGTA